MVSQTKIDDTFLVCQFCINGCTSPYCRDGTLKKAGMLFYIREYIPFKIVQIKPPSDHFEDFLCKLILKEKVAAFLFLRCK